MAPYDLVGSLGSWGPGLVAMLLGVGFGFALERGGLGNATKLAAQFYFTDLRVLKTMFSAIVTAMVLLLIATGLGWLDDTALWINPTHLWPGILGGLLLGGGFIVGGYCPGTSLVALATGKVDGLVFLLGVLAGTALFGATVPMYWASWHHWGDMGSLTLFDWMGIPKHWLVLGIITMALSWFLAAQWAERWRGELRAPSLRERRWMWGGASALMGLAVLGVVIGQPDLARRLEIHAHELDAQVASRDFHLAPDELLDLMHNHRVALGLVDVRHDADFNRFHLLGSQRLPEDAEIAAWATALPGDTLVVITGNDETAAERAWRQLTVSGAPNVYLLEGGLNAWLERFGDTTCAPLNGASESLRCAIDTALGSHHKLASPSPHDIEPRPYTPKVKMRVSSGGGGGCG